MTEVVQGYGPTIRYMLKVIRTAGSYIGIVGFSAGATTAYTLVSLAERRESAEFMQNSQIDSNICFYILTPAIQLLPPLFHFAICLAALYCLTFSINLYTIRKFKRLFCILSGILIRTRGSTYTPSPTSTAANKFLPSLLPILSNPYSKKC